MYRHQFAYQFECLSPSGSFLRGAESPLCVAGFCRMPRRSVSLFSHDHNAADKWRASRLWAAAGPHTRSECSARQRESMQEIVVEQRPNAHSGCCWPFLTNFRTIGASEEYKNQSSELPYEACAACTCPRGYSLLSNPSLLLHVQTYRIPRCILMMSVIFRMHA
jgi:hypothetical protein